MNFLRLHDARLKVLFEDEDIIAIDKAYGFNAHTNDSKFEHSDQVRDGLIEIFEKQRQQKLHIIHRLDQTTSGVMIFGKSVESAKKYAEYFFHRQVQKTYFFVTKNRSTQNQFHIDKVIVHKGRELDADTDLKLVNKNSGYELWQASPHTGRNHQIRIHAQAAGISILGDEKYEGAQFPFLCLHNHKIEFPNGITITSKLPQHFENLQLLLDVPLAKLFFEVDRRERMYGSAFRNETLRLAMPRNHSEQVEYSLDSYSKFLHLSWHKDHWSATEENRFVKLGQYLKSPLLLSFQNNKDKRWLNADHTEKELVYAETEGLGKFQLRPEAGASAGLSTQLRLHRAWLQKEAEGKKVLSLFAGNGHLSISAAIGKAADVIAVEHNKANLDWAKQSLELNALASEASISFLCRDSLSYLDQCVKKSMHFDLIICEAPNFYRREKGIFKIETEWKKLLEQSLSLLNADGRLLFSTTSESLFIDDIRRALLAMPIKLEINCILPSLDFELPDEKVALKSFLIQRL